MAATCCVAAVALIDIQSSTFDARGPDSYAGKEIFTILTHRLRNLKKRVGWVWYFLRSKKGKEWRRMTAPL